jgi:hypothetical protein
MADFCTKCAEEMFGEEVAPDIDVMKEFESLQPGFCSSGWICEGCGLAVIGKTEEGELQVIRIKIDEDENAESEEQTSEWQKY